MVTKEWLCSPVPSTSSSLPHTHTATGNKTVTYDFAPIISREGCLDFPLEQRKEAKTIKVSLVQSWAWAPLGLGSASPLSLWNILYLPNTSDPVWWWPWRVFFWPLSKPGEEERGSPKGLPSTSPTGSARQSWSIFSQRSNFLLWKSKGSKDRFKFFWLFVKNDPNSWFLEAGTFCCPLTCFDCRVQWPQLLPRGVSHQSLAWVSSHRTGKCSWDGKSPGAQGVAVHMAGGVFMPWKDSWLSTPRTVPREEEMCSL